MSIKTPGSGGFGLRKIKILTALILSFAAALFYFNFNAQSLNKATNQSPKTEIKKIRLDNFQQKQTAGADADSPKTIPQDPKSFSIKKDTVAEIKHKDSPPDSAVLIKKRSGEVKTENEIHLIGQWYKVNNPTQKQLAEAAQIEDDKQIKALLTPNDIVVGRWHSIIDDQSAWDIETGEAGTVVAVVDTGVRGSHEDLSGKVLAGYDYVNNRALSANADSDDNGHGTAMASAIAAIGNNSKGIAGVDWGAKILPIKVMNSAGVGTTSDAVLGIKYAADQGAKIINLSFGRTTPSDALKDAIDYAWDKGSVVISASGNDGTSGVYYPAAYSKVLAVGSIANDETHSSFSNFGPELDVVAPGESITVASFSGDNLYAVVSGTSISAAVVSGAAALTLSRNPDLPNNVIYDSLKNTAVNLSSMTEEADSYYGEGKVNTLLSLKYAKGFVAQLSSQSSYISLLPGESADLQISFRNVNASAWLPDGDYPVRLALDYKNESGLIFKSSSWLSDYRITAVNQRINPGETASFTVPVTAPSNIAPGEYRFYVRLVADGAKWFSDSGAAWWKITVPPMTASYIGQSPYPTLTRGSDATLFVKFRNTSGVTWRAAGSNPVRLAIDKYWAARTAWQGSGWLSENRITVADEGDVQNGAVGTYTFNIHVPIDMPLGDHYFYVRLVADGYSWFDNPKTNGGAWWRFTVTE